MARTCCGVLALVLVVGPTADLQISTWAHGWRSRQFFHMASSPAPSPFFQCGALLGGRPPFFHSLVQECFAHGIATCGNEGFEGFSRRLQDFALEEGLDLSVNLSRAAFIVLPSQSELRVQSEKVRLKGPECIFVHSRRKCGKTRCHVQQAKCCHGTYRARGPIAKRREDILDSEDSGDALMGAC